MEPINANTTDRQIAVRAASEYYPNGAPPELCVRLIAVCRHIDRLPRGGWAETQQAWVQAKEIFERLNQGMVSMIVRQVESMERERSVARRQQELSRAGQTAAAHQNIVDAVVQQSQATNEYPDHDDFYVSVLTQAFPELLADTIAAISKVCVHRMRKWRNSAIVV